jgi:hypothetical protein
MKPSVQYLKLYDYMCTYVESAENTVSALQDLSHLATVLQHEYGELVEQRSNQSAGNRNRESTFSET